MDVRRQPTDNGLADVPAVARRAHDGANGGALSKALAVLLIAVSVVVLGWFVNKAFASLTADMAIKSKEYQAIFLSNGQVYFCKLAKVDASYVKCTDIYYLQVQQQVQPSDKSTNQQPQVSLAKLGGELHGPEDVMYISRQQVLFWENLKNDGKVAKAIQDYKASGSK